MKKKLLAIITLFILAVTCCAFAACTKPEGPAADTQDVTFVVLGEDGANDEIIYVDKGEAYRSKITMPTDPVKTGYEFKGWYTDKGVWSNKISQSYLYNVLLWEEDDSDITVYAKFDIVTYTITYKLDDYFAEVGEAANNPTEYNVKTQFTLKNPTKRQATTTFLGWYNGNTRITEINNTTGDLTLTAKFTSTVKQWMKDGSTTMLFGSYPQTEVTTSSDATLKGELDALFAGDTPSTDNGWTAQLNYANAKKTTIVLQKDFWHKGAKYRAIYFDKYRPSNVANAATADTSLQDDNGYVINKIYFFKFEPIRWQILSEDNTTAKLVSEKIIDSRELNLGEAGNKSNPNWSGDNANYYQNFGGQYWNWYWSWARFWLRHHFIGQAFNYIQENSHLSKTSVSNALQTTGLPDGSTIEAGNRSTSDYLYFFSNQEVQQHFDTATSRQRQATDYAKAMGVQVANGYSPYWLRSPMTQNEMDRAQFVDATGALSNTVVQTTSIGYLPVMSIVK